MDVENFVKGLELFSTLSFLLFLFTYSVNNTTQRERYHTLQIYAAVCKTNNIFKNGIEVLNLTTIPICLTGLEELFYQSNTQIYQNTPFLVP